MKKLVCQYAIVRFLPYIETGEFANVGIVFLCPETGYFDYRILNKTSRINAFFDELNKSLFRDAKNSFELELKRIKQFVLEKNETRSLEKNFVNHIFTELTRPREVLMRFDSVRTLLTETPPEQLNELFAFYVERNFIAQVYEDKLIEKNVRNVLKSADLISRYRQETLGDHETYHATFPFVYMEDGHASKVIKPLNLAHDDPADIFNHGWAWMGKIDKLRAMKYLTEDVMLAVKKPSTELGPRNDMYQEVVEKLTKEKILVVQANDKVKILEFANH